MGCGCGIGVGCGCVCGRGHIVKLKTGLLLFMVVAVLDSSFSL